MPPFFTQLGAAIVSALGEVVGGRSGATSSHDRISVVLQKTPGERVGFTVRYNNSYMIVAEIHDGTPVSVWNRQHRGRQLCRGRRIFSINGHTMPESMLSELRTSTVYHLEVSVQPFTHLLQGMSMLSERNAVIPSFAVDALPHRPAGECNTSECVICFEDNLAPEEEVVQLPCKHAFHHDCVKRWLTSHNARCPLCMQKVECNSYGGSKSESQLEAEVEVADEASALPVPSSLASTLQRQACRRHLVLSL
eukprot:gb/GFBE01077484.1/.p1 GENE.gb/GFBE01077484.1/~~gb/GFBE01077484.1/.p1  ORF type:complete len:251 (+),score=30.17 gb/GFBE01077484.1/:1-753(+)